jgi:hypothetical protein
MRDYLSAADRSRIPDHVVAMYDDGTEGEGVLVYAPKEAKPSAAAETG